MKFYEHLSEAMEHLHGRGAFLTVANAGGTTNTMTISWGYIGFSWDRPIFVVLVRPQRFTNEVIQTADSFTISIPFSDEMARPLAICGSRSGRDVNKLELAGINYAPAETVASPVVAGCDIYYECRISYTDPLCVEKLNKDIVENFYNGDSHNLYFGEITSAYRK